MLRKFFRAISRKPMGVEDLLTYPEGKRIYKEFHNLRRDQMDFDALKVIHRLGRHGHRAYLVGGCVRDMVLEKKPKDFDVATSATPDQIRRIFSNSRAVGRRFKIVHILFREGKIIEVSTFRSLPHHRLKKGKARSYLIRRDNRYGTPQEDAARRDFTANGLYFDPRNESIIDYVGGYADIEKKCIQAVSTPSVSFQEDPVRMLRAAKFAALLDFKIANKTAAAIRHHRNELRKANRSRLLDELVKIFRTGKTSQIFRVLHEVELLKVIFPEACSASRMGGASYDETAMGKRLSLADKSLAEREDLTIVIFFSLILSDLVKDIFTDPDLPNKAEYVRKKLVPVCKEMLLPKRDQDRLFHIYMSYPRLLRNPQEKHSRPDTFRKKVFFYEAFMFFKIHAITENNEECIQKAMFWEIGPRMAPPDRHRAITVFPPRRRNRRSNAESDSRSDLRSSSRRPSSGRSPRRNRRR